MLSDIAVIVNKSKGQSSCIKLYSLVASIIMSSLKKKIGVLIVRMSANVIIIFIYLFVRLIINHLFSLLMCLSILCIYLFIYSFIHSFIHSFIYLFIYLFIIIYIFIYLFICLFIYVFLFIYLVIFLTIYYHFIFLTELLQLDYLPCISIGLDTMSMWFITLIISNSVANSIRNY